MIMRDASLNKESLVKLFSEIKVIEKPRLLIVETTHHVKSEVPLSPSHILTTKSGLLMSQTGLSERRELYWRQSWRIEQHISNKLRNR